ncbi:hypothetical protein PPSIR1_29755 [Plesiocystis pacifica SIR-1]|uniref:Rv2525c-like glycoside hydrolase-like domain-containing protein n=1 Tax=Plesiocystis pacifica SIR-1 TaxID=391625 RepID=A6GID2_9BACT|nr:DUF1906 domain-containing protein [Plesiocystis pacifica]EDM74385.1 hypothetical protein PPSIR1_29755 [Plesiocystis pacifica SIR-1]
MTDLLPGIVQKSGSQIGFDTTTRLDQAKAAEFASDGFTFCVRYISRDDHVETATTGSGSMSRAEAEAILAGGLALMPVQFAQKNFAPTRDQGTTLGTNAAKNAAALGFPEGVNVWCDVEAIDSSSTTQEVVDYANAWASAVSSAGYLPGLYVGPNSKLTTSVLYQELSFQHYWKSAAWVPNVDTRGYQMWQSISMTKFGVYIDVDLVGIDSKQGRPYWLAPDPEQLGQSRFEA